MQVWTHYAPQEMLLRSLKVFMDMCVQQEIVLWLWKQLSASLDESVQREMLLCDCLLELHFELSEF